MKIRLYRDPDAGRVGEYIDGGVPRLWFEDDAAVCAYTNEYDVPDVIIEEWRKIRARLLELETWMDDNLDSRRVRQWLEIVTDRAS